MRSLVSGVRWALTRLSSSLPPAPPSPSETTGNSAPLSSVSIGTVRGPRLHSLLAPAAERIPLPSKPPSAPPPPQLQSPTLFRACLESHLRQAGLAGMPQLTDALVSFSHHPFQAAAMDQLALRLSHGGCPEASITSLQESWKALFKRPPGTPLHPLSLPAPEVHYEVFHAQEKGIVIAPVAGADTMETTLADFRKKDVEAVLADLLDWPVVVVTEQYGWHHVPGHLPLAIREQADAQGLPLIEALPAAFTSASGPEPLGNRPALLLYRVEGLPSQQEQDAFIDYLRSEFFALPGGTSRTLPKRRLAIISSSAWMDDSSVRDAWSEPLARLRQDDRTTLSHLRGIPLHALNLQQLNLQQAWDLLGPYRLSLLQKVVEHHIPLLPLAMRLLAPLLLKAHRHGERGALLKSFSETLRTHEVQGQGRHLIIPADNDWMHYMPRLFSLAADHPVGFRATSEAATRSVISWRREEEAAVTPTPTPSPSVSRVRPIVSPANRSFTKTWPYGA